MGKHGRKVDHAGRLVDHRRLHNGQFVFAVVLRIMSSPLESEAYWKLRPCSPRSPGIVAVRDFSGLSSSGWPWPMRRRAPRYCHWRAAPVTSDIEGDCTRLRSTRAQPVSNRLLGVLRHQGLELSLRSLVILMRLSGRAKQGGKLGP
jgi:hypothetical protein